MTPSEAVEALRVLATEDEVHTRDCDSVMGPPGPFPCDCDAAQIILTALRVLA